MEERLAPPASLTIGLATLGAAARGGGNNGTDKLGEKFYVIHVQRRQHVQELDKGRGDVALCQPHLFPCVDKLVDAASVAAIVIGISRVKVMERLERAFVICVETGMSKRAGSPQSKRCAGRWSAPA